MRKLIVVRFGGMNQIITLPVGPVYEVIRTGKAVKGIFATFPEGAKIKHHPQIAHFLQYRITGNTPGVMYYGFVQKPLPVNHVVRYSHANTLEPTCFDIV